ncbi:unnamed protein product [Owenia fusiformis]|uniref:EGF-like domain-containing protein n=1 Tax=Owenia fusiformis TaxID=6347 RepID=A0A8S4P846_OWEFU|nr:unnamed protein product [Owenia fusiformis]
MMAYCVYFYLLFLVCLPLATAQSSGPCSSNPCFNGGTCAGNNTKFVCRCSLGYTGTYCERDELMNKLLGGIGIASLCVLWILFLMLLCYIIWMCRTVSRLFSDLDGDRRMMILERKEKDIRSVHFRPYEEEPYCPPLPAVVPTKILSDKQTETEMPSTSTIVVSNKEPIEIFTNDELVDEIRKRREEENVKNALENKAYVTDEELMARIGGVPVFDKPNWKIDRPSYIEQRPYKI